MYDADYKLFAIIDVKSQFWNVDIVLHTITNL